jgi:hypothetical protein
MKYFDGKTDVKGINNYQQLSLLINLRLKSFKWDINIPIVMYTYALPTYNVTDIIRQVTYVQCNTKSRSRNHCCRRKAMTNIMIGSVLLP